LEPFPRGRLVFTRIGIFQCLGGGPDRPTPPCHLSGVRIRAASVQLPALGPFWFGREPVTKPPAFASTISLVAGRGSNGALAEILSTNPIQPVSSLWLAPAPSVTRGRTGSVNPSPLTYRSGEDTLPWRTRRLAPFWNAAVPTVSKRATRQLPVQPVRTA
jgi:hypothetical protein